MCWNGFAKALVKGIVKVSPGFLAMIYGKNNQNSDIKNSVKLLPKNNQGGKRFFNT